MFRKGLATPIVTVDFGTENFDWFAGVNELQFDAEIPFKTVAFCNSFHCSETGKTYLMQWDVHEAVFSPLHEVEKEGLSSQKSKHPSSMAQPPVIL
ncbi:hypothetical protein TNCV_625871 [Trichonephila clavipes]|nr:hypothetical protein TNCV_625871 [Trichonephila clavipes]